MDTISLNGSWHLYQSGNARPIPAAVPGQVHVDLLAAGLIEDPYYRANELDAQWVGESDWTYRRTFTVSETLLTRARVLLRFQGLDTLATIMVNGVEVGRADNMFRIWEFDIRPVLHPGENELSVHFAAPLPYARHRLAERYLPNWSVGQHKLPGGNWMRKSQCNFGWDWGPQLTTCGIWRDVELLAFDMARLADLHLRQEHEAEGKAVVVRCDIVAERVRETPLQTTVTISYNGETAAEETVRLEGGRGTATLVIDSPRLWWPRGMGKQPLYDVDVVLTGEIGDTLDRSRRRIGLRTLRLGREPDEWGESFYFSANGIPFFAKGANWIPADTFPARIDRAWYRALLESAAAANMNMLRVWGGGIYEDDTFYELCDELGLCVWQDFMFACAAYPTFDRDFMDSVQAEAEDHVRRLRHHACLALWCGNNELEQGLVREMWTVGTMSWEDYSRLFDQMLPRIVKELDPDTDYWPGSPHSPLGDREDWNNPRWGDAHIWDVWHGKEPFEFYRTCYHRFNSEFGFQSFPELRTVSAFTAPEDRNITSYVMEHHQRSPSGNQLIMHYMLDWFRLPTSFGMTLCLSQIQQGMAMKYAVEHWRRTMPRGMGTLYWQLNDTWPAASWSSLDYYGRWKALHYMARHFFASLLLSAVEEENSGRVEVHLTNDLAARYEGQVRWQLVSTAGEPVEAGAIPVQAPARTSRQVATLELDNALATHGKRNLLLWLALGEGEEPGSTNLVLWSRPKHLTLVDPGIQVEVAGPAGDAFQVTVQATHPGLWVWLEGVEARYSDNFFHLLPGRPRTITVTPAEKVSGEVFRRRLRAYSLYNTY